MSSKTKEIMIKESNSIFSLFTKSSISKEDYNFDELESLKRLLSNERARMLHTIKTKKPTSIYDLSKKLNRTFKSVFEDIKLLKRFGFINLVEEKINNRIRHRPEIVIDKLIINVQI